MPEVTDAPLVRYRRIDSIGYITLDRPAKLNALTTAMLHDLAAALRDFDDDPAAGVAVVHGAGRAFCSGADVRERQLVARETLAREGGPEGRGPFVSDLFFRSVHWKPIVAAIHGYAFGIGLRLALYCDLVIAETGTTCQVTETSRGLDSTYLLAALRERGPAAFADDVTLTGRTFTADEAHDRGIISRLVEPGRALDAAKEVAGELLANPPLAVRGIVRVRRSRMQANEVSLLPTGPRELYLTEDFAESARAFVEGRRPDFHGR